MRTVIHAVRLIKCWKKPKSKQNQQLNKFEILTYQGTMITLYVYVIHSYCKYSMTKNVYYTKLHNRIGVRSRTHGKQSILYFIFSINFDKF